MKLTDIFFVFIGSGLGGVCRYLANMLTPRLFASLLAWPWATMIVNILGCLLIGVFYGLSDSSSMLSPKLRLLLTVGFCGGFTTFSTFANENYLMLQANQLIPALLYTLLSVVIGVGAVYLGYLMTR